MIFCIEIATILVASYMGSYSGFTKIGNYLEISEMHIKNWSFDFTDQISDIINSFADISK